MDPDTFPPKSNRAMLQSVSRGCYEHGMRWDCKSTYALVCANSSTGYSFPYPSGHGVQLWLINDLQASRSLTFVKEKNGMFFLILLWFWRNSKDLCFVLQSLYIEDLFFSCCSSLYCIVLFLTLHPQCCMACIYFENKARFNFVLGISAHPCASLETSGMAPSPR